MNVFTKLPKKNNSTRPPHPGLGGGDASPFLFFGFFRAALYYVLACFPAPDVQLLVTRDIRCVTLGHLFGGEKRKIKKRKKIEREAKAKETNPKEQEADVPTSPIAHLHHLHVPIAS